MKRKKQRGKRQQLPVGTRLGFIREEKHWKAVVDIPGVGMREAVGTDLSELVGWIVQIGYVLVANGRKRETT